MHVRTEELPSGARDIHGCLQNRHPSSHFMPVVPLVQCSSQGESKELQISPTTEFPHGRKNQSNESLKNILSTNNRGLVRESLNCSWYAVARISVFAG
ncbi:hypothetical protein CEXT_708411 [Caerostris extrusa]|uniref:Uncharacterized protein n=1 Tax=Caerostris extrusa TaxID=172846 RepID=A0AAV4SVS9_CAEEX|nr:hypothetical protein CEXT_708411 [Caerostris extrusa]